jgi:hypothetical protein
MPRPLLVILKACWAFLAWVLFLSGVIGCAGDIATHTDTVAPDAVRADFSSSSERPAGSRACQ